MRALNAHLEKGTFLFAFEIDSGVNTCLKRSNYLSNFARLQGTIQQKKNIIDKTMFCGNRETATLFIHEREGGVPSGISIYCSRKYLWNVTKKKCTEKNVNVRELMFGMKSTRYFGGLIVYTQQFSSLIFISYVKLLHSIQSTSVWTISMSALSLVFVKMLKYCCN